MNVRIIRVHPSLTVVEYDGKEIEIPTGWFPSRPAAGQTWRLNLERYWNEREQLEELNRHLA